MTYQWQKAVPTNEGWENINDETAKTFTVTESMIATYGDYRVLVYDGNRVLIGSDTRSVMDATDPYIINLHPNPADETIDEDESGNPKVTYTPRVAVRGGKEIDGFLFCFSVKDAGGAPLNKWQNGNGDELDAEMATTAQKSYEVTRAQCAQAQGNVNLTVFAVKS